MADTYDAIAALAVDLSGDVDITILATAPRPPPGLSRAGGRGFALGDRHPIARGTPMTHLWTLATADVPVLRRHYPHAAAVAMYLRSPPDNQAYAPDSGETALIALSELDVRGGAGAATPDELPERAVIARTVAVPASAFTSDDDDSEDSVRNRLCEEILDSSCRAGGPPIWIQGDEHDGDFLLQFTDDFVELNLGDAGVMYVFTDQQFWQCH